MGSTYWRVEFIQPASPTDDRCVMLHGQLEEIVGPMSVEMAEAWIVYFDNRQTVGHHGTDGKAGMAIPLPNLSLPQAKPAG